MDQHARSLAALSCRAKSRHPVKFTCGFTAGWKAWPRGLRPLRCSLDFARNDKTPWSRRRRLTFCACCALKRFENLWNVSSLSFCTEFSLLSSFYSSQVAAKTRASPPTLSIWAVLTGASRLLGPATASRIGTAITPAVVLRLRSALENSAPTFTRAASSWVFHNYQPDAKD